MKKWIIQWIVLFTALGGSSQSAEFSTKPVIEYEALVEGFRDIPHEARMRAWWFWHAGQATKQSITQDLEAMKANGIGGAILCDNGSKSTPSGPVFMSEAWLDLFAHVIREGTRLGIEISANMQSGCGDPGNPRIAADNGLKKIVTAETTTSGPGKVALKLPMPPASNIFYEDIAIQAVRKREIGTGTIKNWSIKSYNKHSYNLDSFYEALPDEGRSEAIDSQQIVDLTSKFQDGVLTWDVPHGDWTIIRYGMTATGKLNHYASQGYKGGLCYDPINARGLKAQFNDVGKPLIEIAKKSGTSLKFLHIDSWEMGLCNWTQDFEESFRKYRGYDMRPYLPVLAGKIVDSREISNRFLEDFRLTISDLAVDENYQLLNTLADADGISFHAESAGPHQPPVDGLRSLAAADIPMGEAWSRAATHRVQEPKRMQVALGASAAHIYGKRYLAAEAPTSIGPVWERSPSEVKNVLDRILCTGANRINWHTYDSSPDEFGLPGIAYMAGTHLNRNVTWWKESKEFIAYINRSQHMLTQGLHVADVLGFLGSRVPFFAVLHRLERNDIPAGYAWDMCNADAFLKRASVKDGRIILPDGKSYALFALSDDRQMYLPLLRKIEKLVREGMILVGNPPQRPFGLSGYPESDAEFKAVVKKLWGDADGSSPVVKPYGKGSVYAGHSTDKVLEKLGIGPDLAWQPSEDVDLEYIHHTSVDGNIDVYYVINKWARHGINDLTYRYTPSLPDRFVNVRCSFRVDGERQVERWDPVSGRITPVHVYENRDGYYHLPVSLEPEGGAFYVFRKASSRRHVNRIAKDGVVLNDGNTPLEVGASECFFRDEGLEVLDKGNYKITFADGKSMECDHPAATDPVTIGGSWNVDFLERSQLGSPFSATYNVLKSWTKSENRAEKYFSGTARYTKSFSLSKDMSDEKLRAYLDLGYVGDVATIRLNGEKLGVLWKAPYIIDITDHVKPGENRLEVDVTNLWINRLVGDQKLPPDQRKARSNLLSSRISSRLKREDADKNLRASGLIGPVRILLSRVYEVTLF